MDSSSSPADTRAKVEALLNPKNVVVVGASDKSGSWATRAWRNVKRQNFPGGVYPFNTSRDMIGEERCYRRFEDLPEKPDHLVIAIPAPYVADTLRAAAKAGARSAAIFTAGFDESPDPEGQRLGNELRKAIIETGIAVSGPNCMGNISGHASYMSLVDDRPQRIGPGAVAVIGQSGGLVMALKRSLEERGVPCGYLITSGNETGLTTADYINFFAHDPRTKVIVSYLESVHNPAAFLEGLQAARAAGKPVVICKLGASAEGRAAAMAHTGALAGSMEAFDAIAGEAGAVRVRTLDDAVEAAEYFTHAQLPKGNRLGAITFSGGLRGLLLDVAGYNGLHYPALAESTKQRLSKVLGVGTIIGNPLDSGFAGLSSSEVYIECVRAMHDDPSIDFLLLQEELPRVGGSERKETNLRNVNDFAATAKKPIAMVTMVSHGQTEYSQTLRQTLPNVAFLQEVDRTLRTVRTITTYAARMRAPRPKASRSPEAARKKLEKALAGLPATGEPTALSEVDSKAVFKAYGVAAPKEKTVTSAAAAVKAAKAIGFPVVLKVVSAEITHKSDVGGVIVGVDSPAAVSKGYKQIMASVAKKAKGAVVDGILVAEMVTGGQELVLGASNDPEMGPLLMFGSGGVALELYKDVGFSAPPLDEARAAALIDRTSAGRIIAGYRGSAALDKKAAVKALIGLSQLVADLGPRLHSIDVNPFVLRKKGGVALDALIVVAGRKG
jgi:acyl-CoA synthetase (NDP forming)